MNQFLYNYLISHTLDEVIRLKSTILLFKTLIDSTSDENWNPQKYQELVKQSLGIEVSVNCIELFRNIDKSILEEKLIVLLHLNKIIKRHLQMTSIKIY